MKILEITKAFFYRVKFIIHLVRWQYLKLPDDFNKIVGMFSTEYYNGKAKTKDL